MVCSLFVFSCKKDATIGSGSKHSKTAVVGANQEPLVKQQLRWIARGIPDYAHPNQPFRQIVENLCNNVPGAFYATNTDIQADASSQLSQDYEQEVYNNVNNRFPMNSYDRNFFFEIEIDGCMNNVGIRIPELDIIDKTKKLVVLPGDPFTNGGDSIYGYYVNDTVLGPPILDSVLIDEDNMDSVYLWVVSLVESCLDSSMMGGFGTESMPRAEYCDGDSICEPEHGENALNCTDCQGITAPNRKLTLTSITSLTDKKKFSSFHPEVKYQEAHIQNRYDVCFTYSIVDHNTLTPKDTRLYHAIPGNSAQFAGDPYTPPAEIFKAWGKNAEMKRCKKKRRGGTKCNRGSSTTKTPNDVLSVDFDKNNDAIYFLVFERDDNRQVTDETISIDNASGTSSSIVLLHEHSAPGKPYSWTFNNRTGQMEHIFEILPNDPNFQWVPDPGGGNFETMVLTFDGEIQFLLTLE